MIGGKVVEEFVNTHVSIQACLADALHRLLFDVAKVHEMRHRFLSKNPCLYPLMESSFSVLSHQPSTFFVSSINLWEGGKVRLCCVIHLLKRSNKSFVVCANFWP